MFGLTPLFWKLAGIGALVALIGGLGWYGLHQHDARLLAESQLKTAVATVKLRDEQQAKVDAAKRESDRRAAVLSIKLRDALHANKEWSDTRVPVPVRAGVCQAADCDSGPGAPADTHPILPP